MFDRRFRQQPPPTPEPHRRPRRDGVREFTVTKVCRELRGRRLREVWVPLLRMSGHWLEQCGFEKGSRVFVSAEPGRLVLTTADPAHASVRPVAVTPAMPVVRRGVVHSQLIALRERHCAFIGRRGSLRRKPALLPLHFPPLRCAAAGR